VHNPCGLIPPTTRDPTIVIHNGPGVCVNSRDGFPLTTCQSYLINFSPLRSSSVRTWFLDARARRSRTNAWHKEWARTVGGAARWKAGHINR